MFIQHILLKRNNFNVKNPILALGVISIRHRKYCLIYSFLKLTSFLGELGGGLNLG